MAVDEIVFWVFAPISIGSAIAMLLQRNAVHAALFLVVNFFTIAVFYLVLGASFVVLGAGIAIELIVAIRAGIGFATKAPANFDETVNQGGNAQALARVLFRQYFFPFEVTSVLLIVAAIAVVVFASRRRWAITRAEAVTAGHREAA